MPLIPDHLAEAAGHMLAQIEVLRGSLREHEVALSRLTAQASPLNAARVGLLRRINGLELAVEAMRTVRGRVSWGNRLRQWMGAVPLGQSPSLPPVPTSVSAHAPTPPPPHPGLAQMAPGVSSSPPPGDDPRAEGLAKYHEALAQTTQGGTLALAPASADVRR